MPSLLFALSFLAPFIGLASHSALGVFTGLILGLFCFIGFLLAATMPDERDWK
jgi:hypothetical protein